MRLFGLEISRTKAAQFAPREQKLNRVYPARVDLFNDAYSPALSYFSNHNFRAVIDTDAQMFANADVFETNSKGEKVENSKVANSLKTISKPTFNAFLRQVRTDVNLNGYFIARILKKSDGSIIEINRFNPYSTEIHTKATDKFNYKINYIQTYVGGKSIKLQGQEIEDVFIFSESDPIYENEILKFTTKTDSLKNVLLSDDALWESLKNLNKFRGAQNIVSPNGEQDLMPTAPDALGGMSEKKMQIYSEYARNFGTTNYQSGIMIMDSPVKVDKLSSPISDMEINTQGEMTMDAICNIMSIDPVLFSRQAKFENYKIAQKNHYDNSVIPFSDSFFQSLSAFLFGNIYGAKQLVGDYTYLDVFQEDLIKNREVTEMASTTVINLNTAVLAGQMDKQTAINTLIFGGVDAETAKNLIQ